VEEDKIFMQIPVEPDVEVDSQLLVNHNKLIHSIIPHGKNFINGLDFAVSVSVFSFCLTTLITGYE
jgi:hypothetical protein